MNADQKKRALTALGMWHSSNDGSLREYQAAELMAALLQELIDAPEPEPVAWMYEDAFGTHFAEEYSEISNNPGVLSFTALYTIHPALPADLVRDAEKWRMLPAFLEEFQIPYLQLEGKIDAAIERGKKGGA